MNPAPPAHSGKTFAVVGEKLHCAAIGRSPWSLFRLEADPMAGPPLHTHPWEEAFLVTSGTIRFLCDGVVSTLAPGEALIIPANAPHCYKAVDFRAEAVVVFDSVAPADFFHAIDGLSDMQQITAVARRHGVIAVGPPLGA